MICLGIVLMVILFLSASTYSLITVVLTILVDILAIIAIINRDANPEYKVSWISVVTLLPIVGVILYSLFYTRRMTRREIRLLRGSFSQIKLLKEDKSNFKSLHEIDPSALGKAYAITNDDPISELYVGTSSELFCSGEEYFSSLTEELKKSRHFIFLEYFIICEGALWSRIHKILTEKASEGVEIRVLYDDIGCMSTLPNHYERTLRSEGIKAQRFGRISPRISSVHNNRDHRKMCIIDGKTAFTGGVNIADEYTNEICRFGHWKDGGIRISGSAVAGLTKEFLSLWDFTEGSITSYESYVSASIPEKTADGGYYLPFGAGPSPIYKRSVGKNAILNIVNQAISYVYITTPYLIIDYELTESLCNAAKRGVDVRIITPGIADKKIVKVMTKSAYPHLMASGVRIYEYIPGFIHEKCIVSDDSYAIIGTINLDYRSLAHHFENAVWMYRSPTVARAKDDFLKTLDLSERIDVTRSTLTLGEWLMRCAIKLFAPLL